MILIALALAAAPPQAAGLPACAERLPEDIAACDREVAAEKDSKAKARLLLRRAYVRDERDDYEAAVRDLDAAIAADPSFAEAFHERAYAYGELLDFARAAADADRDVALRPDEADAYRERAYARHSLADLKGAWEDWAKVVALEPKNAAAVQARGRAALWLGRFDDARADTNRALALADAAGDAKAAASARDQLTEIGLWTTRSAAGAPDAACRAGYNGGAPSQTKVIGDCTAAFFAARTADDKVTMLTIRGMAFMLAAHNARAGVDDEAMAVAIEPGNADLRANLGTGYVITHRTLAARRELDIALRLNDGDWSARAERALARYILRDRPGALADAKASFAAHPNALALVVFGDLAHDDGDDKAAKAAWMGAWHLGDRDDTLRARLKGIGILDPDAEPRS